MRDQIIRTVKSGLARYGYELVRSTGDSAIVEVEVEVEHEFPPDFDEATKATARRVEGYTMTSPEKIYALCHAVRHIVQYDVPGAIVECGVWRGGSMMAVATTLLEMDAAPRDLYLFDTFEGMPEPTEHDVDLHGVSVLDRWNSQRHNRLVPREARASIGDVRQAMGSVGYDPSRIHFIKGMVEDTIPAEAPEEIALLRLDTDYYESTRHEMFELYPRVASGGVLIVDDFGHFKGSEKGVREFIDQTGEQILLHRIDYSARVGVKR
ncbi:MAG: TylF/MycF/NovP-related O-methyltransferase [Rhodococcus fascians]